MCVHFNKMTSGSIIKLELREEEKSMIGKKHSCHQIITRSISYVIIWRLLPGSFFKYCNEFRHYSPNHLLQIQINRWNKENICIFYILLQKIWIMIFKKQTTHTENILGMYVGLDYDFFFKNNRLSIWCLNL